MSARHDALARAREAKGLGPTTYRIHGRTSPTLRDLGRSPEPDACAQEWGEPCQVVQLRIAYALRLPPYAL